MGRQRIRLTVRYDGTCFAGSQVQPGARTVAGTLTAELESTLGEQVHLEFASRTDSGVHADGNVCAFEGALPFPAQRLPVVLNPRLPDDLELREARVVVPEFSPRFDALRREYVYRVYRGQDVPVDRRRFVAPYGGPWDGAALAEAVGYLAGEHSFEHFCKGREAGDECRCHLEPVRTEELGSEVGWHFVGNRFLRHMLCRIAGALLAVAGGEVRPPSIERALAGELDFKLRPAPAKGLTLLRVRYPEDEIAESG